MKSATDPRTATGARGDPVLDWLRSLQPIVERRASAFGTCGGDGTPGPAEGRSATPAASVAFSAGAAAAGIGPAAVRPIPSTGMWCAGCGEPILEDQTIVRLNAGVARDGSFSHLLMRPDVLLHAGEADASGQAGGERWCVTEQGIGRAVAMLRLHGLTGASTR